MITYHSYDPSKELSSVSYRMQYHCCLNTGLSFPLVSFELETTLPIQSTLWANSHPLVFASISFDVPSAPVTPTHTSADQMTPSRFFFLLKPRMYCPWPIHPGLNNTLPLFSFWIFHFHQPLLADYYSGTKVRVAPIFLVCITFSLQKLSALHKVFPVLTLFSIGPSPSLLMYVILLW